MASARFPVAFPVPGAVGWGTQFLLAVSASPPLCTQALTALTLGALARARPAAILIGVAVFLAAFLFLFLCIHFYGFTFRRLAVRSVPALEAVALARGGPAHAVAAAKGYGLAPTCGLETLEALCLLLFFIRACTIT